jgi:DnaJ-domain-containing protein 1
MSIGKRLIDLARSNLTDFRDAFGTDRLREMLHREPEQPVDEHDESLGAKAGKRARRFRDAAEEAWEKAYENARTRTGARGEPPTDPAVDRRRWYRTLELEPGASLQEVRTAYRRLMRTYHPDRYARDPEKLQAATEVTRKLTEAYNGLQSHLDP